MSSLLVPSADAVGSQRPPRRSESASGMLIAMSLRMLPIATPLAAPGIKLDTSSLVRSNSSDSIHSLSRGIKEDMWELRRGSDNLLTSRSRRKCDSLGLTITKPVDDLVIKSGTASASPSRFVFSLSSIFTLKVCLKFAGLWSVPCRWFAVLWSVPCQVVCWAL